MTRGLVSSTSCSARGAAEWRGDSPGSLDVVFLLTSSLDAAAAPGRFQRVPGRVPVYSRCRQEAESPGGMERFFLERLVSGRRHSAVAGLVSWSAYPAAGVPRRLLVDGVLGRGGGRLLCVASRLTSSVRTDAVYVLNGRLSCVGCRCWWAQQWPIARTGGVSSPPSSLASTSEAAALLQGEEDGRPGTVVLSNPADGRAMPLVRGEGNPAA